MFLLPWTDLLTTLCATRTGLAFTLQGRSQTYGFYLSWTPLAHHVLNACKCADSKFYASCWSKLTSMHTIVYNPVTNQQAYKCVQSSHKPTSIQVCTIRSQTNKHTSVYNPVTNQQAHKCVQSSHKPTSIQVFKSESKIFV